MYVNLSAAVGALVPPDVVTVTSTVPEALTGGLVARAWVSDTGVKVAPAAPKWTALNPVRAQPVIVTVAPPAGWPELGAMPVTVGAC